MKEFMDELARNLFESRSLANGLAEKYNVPVSEPPLVALSMCFNYATIALELTSHYDAAWGKPAGVVLNADQIAKLRAENAERLMQLSKTTFVWSMSAVEYAAKRAMEKYPKILSTKKAIKSLYLGDIIKASADSGLIGAEQRPLWFGANTIRNKVVHNNGVGDAVAMWQFSKDLSVTMEDGKMIEGTIMTFPRLARWLIDAYADWSDRLLQKAI